MKYNSITTSGVQHDAANMLVELMWLNNNLMLEEYPWQGARGREWGKAVSAIKKLMKAPFDLSADQLAFYMYKCVPREINSKEFAKMAVVAKKLLRRFDLGALCTLYIERRESRQVAGIDKASHKKQDAKSLMALLKELEKDGK